MKNYFFKIFTYVFTLTCILFYSNTAISQSPCSGSYTGSSTLTVPSTGYSYGFEGLSNGSSSASAGGTSFGGWGYCSAGERYWRVWSGGTGSSSTGPSSARTGSKYIYFEASYPNYQTAYDEGRFGRYVNFSNLTTPKLQFYTHMYGSSIGVLHVYANGTLVGTWSGNQGNVWQLREVDLGSYGGQTQVLIEFCYDNGSSYWGDIAIDDIRFDNTGTSGGGPGPIASYACSASYGGTTVDVFPHTTDFESVKTYHGGNVLPNNFN
jgi:MAM domain.